MSTPTRHAVVPSGPAHATLYCVVRVKLACAPAFTCDGPEIEGTTYWLALDP
ncbi:MAG TPA: hypothetical protein VNL91_08055 [Thermoanaerobaculia bacterium]|nr:hypothetical protein [Thermoanaerobaculia bacterium]